MHAGMPTLDTLAVSIVVPVFNSERTLHELVARLEAVLGGLDDYELILVDDGSVDGSREIARQLAVRNSRVRSVLLTRNFGQHNAVLAGIREARFPVTVTVDDDLQNPPEEIPRLLEALARGNDVIYGVPSRAKQPFWRVVASKLVRLALMGTVGRQRASIVTSFRAFRTDLRRAFESYSGPFVSVDVLLTWGAARFEGVRVAHDPRRHGRSQYAVPRLAVHAINMLTGFGSWPLRLASVTGFCFTLFGLGILAFVIGRYLIAGDVVPGFPFLASTIALFSGAQLFALGILGEYLANVHFRTMNRPPYVLEHVETGDSRGRPAPPSSTRTP